MIKQRNDYVVKSSSELSPNSKILDVGCGTGDLVIDLLKDGFDAYGIDFSSEMIKIANNYLNEFNLPPNHFQEISFFDFESNINYDLISANGFIEYISFSQLNDFLKKSNDLLSENGLLVFGSRNRLFNAFSMNSFTLEEVNSHNLEYLISESTIFNSSKNLKDLMGKFEPVTLDLPEKQSMTDIDVNIRYQYTPFQLFTLLKDHNFEILEISPVHIHGISPSAKSINPQLHSLLSNFLHNQEDLDYQLIPQSSSFMIKARKI